MCVCVCLHTSTPLCAYTYMPPGMHVYQVHTWYPRRLEVVGSCVTGVMDDFKPLDRGVGS